MSAQPATNDDYQESRPSEIPFRRPAKVISLPRHRSEDIRATPLPESHVDESVLTAPKNSGLYSGTRITLGDVPGDWASVAAVWTGTPEPLSYLVTQVIQARDSGQAPGIALACWALLVLIPRGVLHLASWVLTHPVRLAAVAIVAAVFIATR